jgi:hypothetical protein
MMVGMVGLVRMVGMVRNKIEIVKMRMTGAM